MMMKACRIADNHNETAFTSLEIIIIMHDEIQKVMESRSRSRLGSRLRIKIIRNLHLV